MTNVTHTDRPSLLGPQMVVGKEMEPYPATALHAHVGTVSTSGSVGCPKQSQWARGKCDGGAAGGKSLGVSHYQTGAPGH